ncbi:DUF4433 domain-containing protein [Moraxella oblonga]|uniref:DUF4433 domain-containing protein n=1 Tax=Moraxella oblonga TaxID=200413 RepID=UPI00082A737F|nr:DUF4433 domain-containing protein [Moraxella oblonga]
MKFYSTKEICQIYGLQFNPFVTNFLINNKYVFRSDNGVYHLTELGKQYGKMDLNHNNQRRIFWNKEKFSPILQNLKKNFIENHKNRFKLYHMTHIDNLKSICEIGALLSHNQIKNYTDISNQSVNAKRSKQEPFCNRSIHDYVPLYFNPRNAMLYNVQSNFGNEVIILEIDVDISLQPYTLFTYKNAATNDALFFDDVIEFLDDADWSSINRYTWFDDPTGITKKAMMSECLILDKIPISFIKHIECTTEEIGNKIVDLLSNYSNMPLTVYYDSNLFFKI